MTKHETVPITPALKHECPRCNLLGALEEGSICPDCREELEDSARPLDIMMSKRRYNERLKEGFKLLD